MVKLFSKNSNLCDHNSPTSQTDGQTTCDRNTALCTKEHRAVKMLLVTPFTNITVLKKSGMFTVPLELKRNTEPKFRYLIVSIRYFWLFQIPISLSVFPNIVTLVFVKPACYYCRRSPSLLLAGQTISHFYTLRGLRISETFSLYTPYIVIH